MSEPDEEAMRTIMLSKEVTDHLATIMPIQAVSDAMESGALILLTLMAAGTPVGGMVAKMTSLAAINYAGACMLKSKANGRKLTNKAKRDRLAHIIAMMRDTADQLEAVLMAENTEKAE